MGLLVCMSLNLGLEEKALIAGTVKEVSGIYRILETMPRQYLTLTSWLPRIIGEHVSKRLSLYRKTGS